MTSRYTCIFVYVGIVGVASFYCGLVSESASKVYSRIQIRIRALNRPRRFH